MDREALIALIRSAPSHTLKVYRVSDGHRALVFGHVYVLRSQVLYYDSPGSESVGQTLCIEDGVDAFLAP